MNINEFRITYALPTYLCKVKRRNNTVKTQNTSWLPCYFDSDMSKITNTVVYFDWKTVIYIYVSG